jgi:hypothetical protein
MTTIAPGPYDTEQSTYTAPLLVETATATPGGGVFTRINRDHLLVACQDLGVELGAFDVRILHWLAGYEAATVQVVIGLIGRAYAAGIEQGRNIRA